MWSDTRADFVIIIALFLVTMAIVPYPVQGAQAEAKYEAVVDGVTYGNDVILTGLNQSIFHDHVQNASDNESFSLASSGELNFSPSQGTEIALPSISQSTDQTLSESTTGFYYANYPYCPFINNGAAPIGVGQFGKTSPVEAAKFRGRALMYPEMVNQGILNPNLTFKNNNINSSMLTLPPALATEAFAETAAIGNDTIGETPRKNSSLENLTPPMLLSEQRFNLDANSSQINNMSIIERMWRNSHIAHLMHVAFEGEVSRPAWLEPLKPTEGLQRSNHSKVLSDALNMTMPGKYIKKDFWDINPLVPGRL